MKPIAAAARLLAAFAVLAGAFVIGESLNGWRAARVEPEPTAGPAAATGMSAPATSPLVAWVTRDEAIALVRSLAETVRVDRIEAKLVSWGEFAAVGMGVDRTGGPVHGGGTPETVWAIAVAGDTYPEYWGAPLGTPKRHFAWALWGVNARRLQVSTLKVGDSGTWPTGFDALADHVAVAPAPPTPTPSPIPFDLVAAPGRLTLRIHDLAARDADGLHLWAIVRTGSRDASGREITSLMRSDDGGASWTAVAGVTRNPFSVAAAGSVVLVSDPGADTADNGWTTSGGLFASSDGGSTWKQVSREGVLRVASFGYQGRTLFLAERWWATKGAATGPSRIYASLDGETWREIGEVPGPANFGMLDVPLVAYSKNVPGDGVYRVEGSGLASLRLVPIPGSVHHCCGVFLTGPGNELWSFDTSGGLSVLRSADGWRTTQPANTGLAGRIAGLFVYRGSLYAVGDGAYRWDGAAWQAVTILISKADGVFQLGQSVFIQGVDGTLYKAPLVGP